MSPRFVLGRQNVPCVAEVVNRSLKADCTDFTSGCFLGMMKNNGLQSYYIVVMQSNVDANQINSNFQLFSRP